MHEGNFTREIVSAILDELEHYPCFHARQVKVRVGEMLHLEPESVQTHFRQLAKGTELEGTELILEETPVEVKCRSCGFTGGAEDHHVLICMQCSSFDVELLSGKEVTIDSIEMDETSTGGNP